MREWLLTYPKRPWTVNAERRMHYHARAKLVKEWREVYAEMVKEQGIPALNTIGIEVYVTSRTKALADTGACFAAHKAAVDGIVDAGVVPDDKGEYVKWITFYPVNYLQGIDSMTIKIVELS